MRVEVNANWHGFLQGKLMDIRVRKMHFLDRHYPDRVLFDTRNIQPLADKK